MPGLGVAAAFSPCQAGRGMPSSPRHVPARPSTLATQTSCSEQYPETSSFPSAELGAALGRGNIHLETPKTAENAKKKKRGIYNALYTPSLAKPRVCHTSSHQVCTSLWAVQTVPEPAAWGGRGGGGSRVQLGVEQAESISRFPFTLFEPHLGFVSAADTSSEVHPSSLD